MGTAKKEWIKACLWAFIAGALIIAPLDFYHTYVGTEKYLFDNMLTITSANWPFYLPIQMGLIGVAVLIFWTLFRQYVIDPFWEKEIPAGPGSAVLIPASTFFIILGYIIGDVLTGNPYHASVSMLLFMLSLIYVTLFHSKHQILIFVIVALMGPFSEWVLLDPRIGYYEFVQKDFFGRAPFWLFFVYGWVGIFIHQLSRRLPRLDAKA